MHARGPCPSLYHRYSVTGNLVVDATNAWYGRSMVMQQSGWDGGTGERHSTQYTTNNTQETPPRGAPPHAAPCTPAPSQQGERNPSKRERASERARARSLVRALHARLVVVLLHRLRARVLALAHVRLVELDVLEEHALGELLERRARREHALEQRDVRRVDVLGELDREVHEEVARLVVPVRGHALPVDHLHLAWAPESAAERVAERERERAERAYHA